MPPPGRPFADAPPVYRATNGNPPGFYGSGYGPSGPVPPPGRPYFVPDDRARAQPAPSLGGDSVPQPPAYIGGSAPADAAGSVSGAPGAASEPDRATVMASLPPEYRPERGSAQQPPPRFRRQLVNYPTSQPAGTIIIDTAHTFLYLVRGHGKALRYGIGVGRAGFTWSGTEHISRMKKWPDWHPPKEMIERQPYLPRFMAGGEDNPLGARALYLGNTLYRIHGTNQPSTVGTFVSSGCIRLTNADIEDLYDRVNTGTRVVVLPGAPPASAVAQSPVGR